MKSSSRLLNTLLTAESVICAIVTAKGADVTVVYTCFFVMIAMVCVVNNLD